MSFTITAENTSIILPSPEFSNTEASSATMNRHTSMDGTVRTYVQKKNRRRKSTWDFRMTRNKSLELRNFFLAYAGVEMIVRDQDNRTWRGYFMNNPIEIRVARIQNPAFQGWCEGSTVEVTLEFEGNTNGVDSLCFTNQVYSRSIVDTHGVDDSSFRDVDFPSLPGARHRWDAQTEFGAASAGTPVATWSDVVGTADFNLIGVGVPYGGLTVKHNTTSGVRTFIEPNGGTPRLQANIVEWFRNRIGTLYIVMRQQFNISTETGYKSILVGPSSPSNTFFVPGNWASMNPGPVAMQFFSNDIVDVEVAGALPQNTIHVLTFQHNTADGMINFRRNRLPEAGRSVPFSETGQIGGTLRVGDIELGEVLYFSAKHTVPQMESMEDYLMAKWGT